MSAAVPRDGGCSCGRVRYRLLAEPIFVNACHCSLCQRQTGSAFVLNAMIEAANISLMAGETEMTQAPAGSGVPQRIHRCPACRTALWSFFRGRTSLAFLRAGTLDDPASVAPGAHVFTTTRLPWLPVPHDVPSFSAFYDPAQMFSPDGLARFQAAIALG